MKAVSWELAAKIEYRELAVKAFLLLVSNSESESLKAEQGGNLQFVEYHGNLQYNALTTYIRKKVWNRKKKFGINSKIHHVDFK